MSANGDPVETWFEQLDSTSRQAYRSYWGRFFAWLRTQKGFENIEAIDLLKLQRQLNRKAPTDDDPTPELNLPKLFKNYANGLDIRYTSKLKMWTVIRSFFKYNDCPFPEVQSVRITSDKIPVQPKLTLEIVRQGISAANIRDKSWLLVKWMSFQDQERLDYVNRHLSDHVVSEVKAGKDLIRLDFIGRKQEKGKKPYFSYIGRDAIDALKQHFDVNGWPKPGDPIWWNTRGDTLGIDSYGRLWIGLLERLGHVPKSETRLHKGTNGFRYGMGLHEFRDLAKSLCHTKAKGQGFDMDCAKFVMGHVDQLDPNNYDRFFEDVAYVEKHYRIAEPFLNLISNPLNNGSLDEFRDEYSQQLEAIQAKVAERDKTIDQMQNLIREVRSLAEARITGQQAPKKQKKTKPVAIARLRRRK